jgi:hypothetical protein
LKAFRADWEIRETQHRLGLPVVPDALVEVEEEGRPSRMAIEVDLATERHAALRKKFETYRQLAWRALQEWGWTDLRLVVVVWRGGSRREAAVRRILEESWGAQSLLATEQSWPQCVWTSDEPPPHTTPANGKRRVEAPTTDLSTAPLKDGVRLSLKGLAGSAGS